MEVGCTVGIPVGWHTGALDGWPEGGWYPDEALSRTEALRGFTLDAAYAAFMEDQVGSLEVGKKADFIVIDRDLMTIPENELPKIRVLETWLDGKAIYRDSEQ